MFGIQGLGSLRLGGFKRACGVEVGLFGSRVRL